ncbi:GTPase ObgE [Clostridium sp. D2Q-11]|uniref:GTPase Obg n=1 Tax=Anaeromonas frigoriresistens TaxID=2683708 RepID=A0A942UX01_9FIRM|nr:GTPase ObgE [Anaeromonas frigoriresistens]MBS4537162.1 GTPase ObgE [Anaeromonas frigoriresistens]
MFIDKAKIFVKGGNGGHGAVAWRREKYEPSGGPAGGDGGDGGDVILKVDEGLRTLMDLRFKKHFKAPVGDSGRSKRQYGKDGDDLIIRVPPGTIVKDEESGRIIADLTLENDSFVVAKGGRGGRGNAKFATSTRQAPRFAEGGEAGQERWIVLELKLLADVGLIGFPNVGKSTLLSIVSSAKPKIANYHFTTIKPNLGVVRVAEGNSFAIADIPGLIEGAHSGTGLGHDFLRHIERTKVLVHLVDISGQEGRDPIDDFHKINEELKLYNEKLSLRPQIVVANKIDLPDTEENFKLFKEEIEKLGYEVYSISAATQEGVKELIFKIAEKLEEVGEVESIIQVEEDVKLYKLEDENKGIIVRKEEDEYFVEGSIVEKLMDSTNLDDLDSARFFQKRLRDLGIIDRLRDLGISEEDSVNICGYEFEFFE